MIVLVDTSVWIEFFRKKPLVNVSFLHRLVEERRVATCLPIQTEVLSGEMSPATKTVVSASFEAMLSIDPNWNDPGTWAKLVEIAEKVRKKKMGIPGMIDRMILVAAMESEAQLWTLDQKLKNVAKEMNVALQQDHIHGPR